MQQCGFSEAECKIILAQVERRAKYRKEFLKLRTDPSMHAKEAGYVVSRYENNSFNISLDLQTSNCTALRPPKYATWAYYSQREKARLLGRMLLNT